MRIGPEDETPTVVTTSRTCPRCQCTDVDPTDTSSSSEESPPVGFLVCSRCDCRFFYSASRGLF
jgi:hypothetical protein